MTLEEAEKLELALLFLEKHGANINEASDVRGLYDEASYFITIFLQTPADERGFAYPYILTGKFQLLLVGIDRGIVGRFGQGPIVNDVTDHVKIIHGLLRSLFGYLAAGVVVSWPTACAK